MSIIIATMENGHLMPPMADDFFRYHDHMSTEVTETGDVESPIGHVTLRQVDRDAIANYVSEYGDPWASVRRNLSPGWYIDVRGSDGTVWAFFYDGWCEDHQAFCADTLAEETARRNFAEAEKVYVAWAEEVEDA